MQKFLIILGCIFLLAGIFWPWLVRSGLGRLPGDILIRKEGFTVYIPIVTCLIVSIVLSIIFWLMNR